jgi:glycogen operon protein
MNDEEWAHDFARCLGMYLGGEVMEERDRRGNPILDDNFLLLFNSHHEGIHFHLPELGEGCQWHSILDTSLAGGLEVDGYFQGGDIYTIEGRSLALLVQRS